MWSQTRIEFFPDRIGSGFGLKIIKTRLYRTQKIRVYAPALNMIRISDHIQPDSAILNRILIGMDFETTPPDQIGTVYQR